MDWREFEYLLALVGILVVVVTQVQLLTGGKGTYYTVYP